MTMKRPHAWIIRIELNDHVPRPLDRIAVLQHLHVASWRVLLDGRAVPFALALGQDPEVVAVHVHRVRGAVDVD